MANDAEQRHPDHQFPWKSGCQGALLTSFHSSCWGGFLGAPRQFSSSGSPIRAVIFWLPTMTAAPETAPGQERGVRGLEASTGPRF